MLIIRINLKNINDIHSIEYNIFVFCVLLLMFCLIKKKYNRRKKGNIFV